MSRSEIKQPIGSRVPGFRLPGLAGGPGDLPSLLEGKRGAVVLFWSGVCSHCVRYDDYLNDFQSSHPELGFVVIASRQGEDLDQLRAAVAERRLRFRLLIDADRTVAREWLVEQTPRVFLTDPEGTLLYRGAVDNYKYPDDPEHEGYLEAAIEAHLAGRPVPRTETASFGCPIESVYYTMPKPYGN